jgi:hypothetical protein
VRSPPPRTSCRHRCSTVRSIRLRSRKNRSGICYEEYQKQLHRNNALDFDDLLMKTVELFRAHDEDPEKLAGHFRYIMVDEYQDTNTAQFELIRMLAFSFAQSLRGRRRRPVHLQIPGSEYPEHPRFRAGLSGRLRGQAGTELPLHAERARCGQCRH